MTKSKPGVIVAVLFALFSVSGVVLAQPVTRDDIVRFVGAGFSDDIILKKVHGDGLAFELTADEMLFLKEAGVSNAVIEGLLDLSANRGPRPKVSTIYNIAQEFYRSGKYEEAEKALGTHLRSHPTDHKARAVRAIALLRLERRADAEQELAVLASAAAGDGTADSYAKKIRALVKRTDESERAKKELGEALQAYDVFAARKALESLTLTAKQQALLDVQLAIYQGQFLEASRRIEPIDSSGYFFSFGGGDKDFFPIKDFPLSFTWPVKWRISSAQARYQKYMNWANWVALPRSGEGIEGLEELRRIMDPVWAGGAKLEHVDGPRYNELRLEKYAEALGHLVNVAPLDPVVSDLMFNFATMFRPYDEVQRIGDQILAVRGGLRLLMIAENGIYDLVIDRLGGRIYSDRFSQQKVADGNFMRKLKPFSVDFNDIKKLRQSAGVYDSIYRGLRGVKNVEILDFGKGRKATQPALLDGFSLVYGEIAAKQVIQNIGRYVHHVIGRTQVDAKLMELKVSRGYFRYHLRYHRTAVGDTAFARLEAQLLAEEREAQANIAQARTRLRAWNEVVADETVSVLLEWDFSEIEQLLDLV